MGICSRFNSSRSSIIKYSYKNKTNINWKKVDCPVVYTLQRDPSYTGRGGSYKLFRNGLNYKKGFYIPTKLSQTLISDRIRYEPDDIMPCNQSKDGHKGKLKA